MKTGQLDPAVVEYIHEQNLDNVKDAFGCELGDDMWKPGLCNRRRTKLEFRDSTGRPWELFFKRYYPLPLITRVWRFLTFRGKRSQGRTEFQNIQALREAKVGTMREVVCGEQCDFLGVNRSYIIVTSVSGDAIERNGEAFLTRHQNNPLILKTFNDKLIELVSRMHSSGLVHRDLYTSHIFLHDHDGHVELYLIDLARVFRPRKWRMFRWRVKDLAQLKYSAPWLWVNQYWKYFMDGYLSHTENEHRQQWEKAIDQKVTAMQKRTARKAKG
ncbi:MAG: hypothetical protein KAR11_08895 [Phycisphaerae bacterium]|nr:hypothetical protein [Phycisphaerae bacterium]